MEKFYTLEQIAKLLKVHRTYASRLIEQGKMPALKIGRSYRVTESGLFAFLKGKAKEIYTVEEIAKALQLHRNSVIKLIKTKKLQTIKIGKLYRITDIMLERFLNSSGVK